MTMDVFLIAALKDNYIYVLKDHATGAVAVVDPGEADPAIDFLKERNLTPQWILNTHHHWDHSNGNAALVEAYGCKIIAPKNEPRIENVFQSVKEGDEIKIGESVAAVIETPAHTKTHISFYFQDNNALFCGDTLFSIGCGRLFEGTPAQMFDSLKKLKSLPDETRVYCGHEYTLANIEFAKTVLPDNAALIDYESKVSALRKEEKSSIPSLLGLEKRVNPFLLAETVADFARLRATKDVF